MTATTNPTQSEFSAGKLITDNPSHVRPPTSRGFARYTLAVGIGVAITLVWQSYGPATKQIIASKAPELGWSPEAKQTIATWIEQLGWTRLPTSVETAAVLETAQAATVERTGPNRVATAPFLDRQQVEQILLDLAALRQTVEQVAASQTKMAGEINNLLVTDMEIFLKIPAPPQPPTALSHKPLRPAPPARALNRRTDVTPNQSLADNFRN